MGQTSKQFAVIVFKVTSGFIGSMTVNLGNFVSFLYVNTCTSIQIMKGLFCQTFAKSPLWESPSLQSSNVCLRLGFHGALAKKMFS